MSVRNLLSVKNKIRDIMTAAVLTLAMDAFFIPAVFFYEKVYAAAVICAIFLFVCFYNGYRLFKFCTFHRFIRRRS